MANGFVNLSIFSVGYEFGARAAFPVEEGLSLGMINNVCMTMGCVFIVIMTFIMEKEDVSKASAGDIANVNTTLIIMFVILLLSALLMSLAVN
jgi:hypothetical protein